MKISTEDDLTQPQAQFDIKNVKKSPKSSPKNGDRGGDGLISLKHKFLRLQNKNNSKLKSNKLSINKCRKNHRNYAQKS